MDGGARESFVSVVSSEENNFRGEPILDDVSIESVDSLEAQGVSLGRERSTPGLKKVKFEKTSTTHDLKLGRKFEIKKFLKTGLQGHEIESLKKQAAEKVQAELKFLEKSKRSKFTP